MDQPREVDAEERELRIGDRVNQIAAPVPDVGIQFVVLAAKRHDPGIRPRAAELRHAVAVQPRAIHDATSLEIPRRVLQHHAAVRPLHAGHAGVQHDRNRSRVGMGVFCWVFSIAAEVQRYKLILSMISTRVLVHAGVHHELPILWRF